MGLYKRVDLKDGEKVQFVGVYVLHWKKEWGKPEVGFVEAEEEAQGEWPQECPYCCGPAGKVVYERDRNEFVCNICDARWKGEKQTVNAINIIFAGEGPGLTFVDAETEEGKPVSVGQWTVGEDGFRRLRITPEDIKDAYQVK